MKRKALRMRWNDWAAVGVAGCIVAVIAYVLILAFVAILQIVRPGIIFHPLGWPFWVAIVCGIIGSIALTLVDLSLAGID
jgi:hypothetical protein